MKKSILFLAVLVLTIIQAKAQCPTATATFPDSACAGSPIPFAGTSSGNNLKYEWDFNISDTKTLPTGNLILNNPSSIGSCLGIDFTLDNGNYYAFSVNLSGNLTRYDFGNSINNSPTTVTLGNLGVLTSCIDFRLLNDNGNWYALTNTAANQLIRLDFGSSLSNTPTATILNVPSSLFNSPYYMAAEKIGDQFYAMVSNNGGANITVIEFGNSLSNNNPNGYNIAVPFSYPVSIAFGIDCNQVYAIVAYSAGYPFVEIDFGSTISATPAAINPLTVTTSSPFRRLDLFNDGNNYILTAQTLGGETLFQFDFGNHLNNLNPTITSLGDMGVLSNGFYTNSVNKIGSSIIGMSGNFNTGDLVRFKYGETNPDNSYIDYNANTTATFTTPGYHTISLTVRDSVTGLYSTTSDSIYINQLPNPTFSYSGACENAEVTLVNTCHLTQGFFTQENWTFSSGGTSTGDTVQYTFPSAGNFDVTLELTTSAGCSKSATQTINIAPLPTAQFSFTNNLCEEADLGLTNTSVANQDTISNYLWLFGDSTTSTVALPSHSYNNFGNYNISLIVTANGCLDTLTQQVSIIEKPSASFTTFNTCIGETVSFQNTSVFTGLGSNVSSWNFGDNSNSNLNSPTHQYAATASTYNVELIELAANGCSDTIAKQIKIGNAPNPSFTQSRDTACVLNNIQFIDNSSPSLGDTIIARYWSFGDGSYDSTNVSPMHSYTAPGTYSVTLTVVSPTYCDSTIVKSVFVIASPIANFTTSNVCLNEVSVFTDNSSPVSGSSINSWHWDFGDGDSSNTTNAAHTYSNTGNYTVTLTVISKEGCFDSTSYTTTIHGLPQVHFSNSKACTGTEIQFTDSTTCTLGIPSTWYWDFGTTGGNSTIQSPTYTYNSAFAYPVKLVVSSNYGCTDSLTKFIIINQSPQFNIQANDNCFNTPTIFQYLPVVGSSTNVGYLWNLGDSSYSSNPSPQHIYNNPGSYNINLTVTNIGNSCTTKVSDTVYVHHLPDAQFQSGSACVNKDLQLTDLSTVSSGSITNYKWTLGNYGTSSIQNPIINLPVADSFLVKLVVTTNYGCKDSITSYAQVNPLPDVTFTPNPYFGAPPLNVSMNAGSGNDQYLWDFGDGTSPQSGSNPNHIFNDTGIFVIHLVATTNKGCIDSSSRNVVVLIPYTDLSIESINFTKKLDFWELSARLKNNGNQTISNFSIDAQLAEKSPINEFFTNDTLVSGQTKTVTFSSRFEVDKNDSPGYLCMEIAKVNGQPDDNISNNKKCITSGSDFEVFNAYPNPFSGELNINVNIPVKGSIYMKLHNLVGETILEPIEANVLKGYNSFPVNLSALSSGIYLLEVRYKDKSKLIKLIKY